jgi:hypothetical protein
MGPFITMGHKFSPNIEEECARIVAEANICAFKLPELQ